MGNCGVWVRQLWRLLVLAGSIGVAQAQPQVAPQIHLATNQDWYPYSGVKDGKSVGLAVDIVRQAFAAVGVTAIIEPMPQLRCLGEVERGLLMGCFSIGRQNPLIVNGKVITHKTPLFVAAPVVFAASDSDLQVRDVEDMRGRRIALTKDAHYGDDVELVMRETRVDAMNELAALRMLVRGRVELTMGDPRSMGYLIHAHPEEFAGRFKIVSRAEGTTNILAQLAFSKKRPEAQRYADLLDEGLAIIKASGEYARIDARWSFQLKPAKR